jgi:chromatin remodeling complex protein RSC6
LSALQKKIVLIDENLSKIVGKEQGSLASYAELTKGVHDYIKKHELKKSTSETLSESTSTTVKFCFSCGSDVAAGSIFCDKCGKKQ